VQILQRGPSAHGDRHAAKGVILLDGGAAHFVEGGSCTNGLLNANASLP